jgi:type I restriction enzyme M protein
MTHGLKDESLEDSENLPAPEVLAAEIVENLESALEQFKSIYEELGKDQTMKPDIERDS